MGVHRTGSRPAAACAKKRRSLKERRICRLDRVTAWPPRKAKIGAKQASSLERTWARRSNRVPAVVLFWRPRRSAPRYMTRSGAVPRCQMPKAQTQENPTDGVPDFLTRSDLACTLHPFHSTRVWGDAVTRFGNQLLSSVTSLPDCWTGSSARTCSSSPLRCVCADRTEVDSSSGWRCVIWCQPPESRRRSQRPPVGPGWIDGQREPVGTLQSLKLRGTSLAPWQSVAALA